MKKFFLILLFFSISYIAYSQNEPGNNLGKSLSTMKKDFPELRYIKTDEKGDEYENGYPKDDIAIFFYFKNNKVIEECLICQTKDGFAKALYDSWVSSFTGDYRYALTTNTYNTKVFSFSYFRVNLIFVSENGYNTALIVYDLK